MAPSSLRFHFTYAEACPEDLHVTLLSIIPTLEYSLDEVFEPARVQRQGSRGTGTIPARANGASRYPDSSAFEEALINGA